MIKIDEKLPVRNELIIQSTALTGITSTNTRIWAQTEAYERHADRNSSTLDRHAGRNSRLWS
jgi:hypothetical protein